MGRARGQPNSTDRTGQSAARQLHTTPGEGSPQQRQQHQRLAHNGSTKAKQWLQGTGQGRVDPPQLTAWLKAATSPEQLLQLVQQHAADLNHMHLSAAYSQAVRVCRTGDSAAKQQLLSELHQLSVRLQQQCGARELATIISSCSKLSSPATVTLLLPLLQQGSTLQQADAKSSVDPPLLTAWLKAATSPEKLLQLLQQHAADFNHIHLSAAYTQAVRVCRQGAAGAQQQLSAAVQQELLSELHQSSVRLQQQCGARQLSNIIWSCGKLHSPATAKLLLPRFLQASSLQQADPQAVSNVMWAAADLQLQLTGAHLQQLLGRFATVLSDAAPQAVSNVLWAVGTMGQQVPPKQLQQLLGRFAAVLPDAKPQEVSNTLWAVATMGQQVQLKQLQQLLGRFAAVLPDAKSQEVANTLWAVATMGQQVPPQQLQQLLSRFVIVLSGATCTPQCVSNTLWAVATMGQQVPPRQLQLALTAFVKLLPAAKPQAVSNVLWACGKMLFIPQQLLQSLQEHAPQLQQLIKDDTQHLANVAWACGELGYRGQLLPSALLQHAVKLLQDGGNLNSQELCNLCWSAVALDLQQCVPQVLQLAAAANQSFSTAVDENLRQLHQVHLWLLDSQLPTPNQGLSGVLTQQQLQQCKASWEQQLTATAKQQSSRLQQSVYAAVLQLPLNTWQQQQPQSEQPTADKACLIDIAAVTASGVKVAIEVEGPQHYVQPKRTLTGATQSRNRTLAARGYAVISIPYWDWDSLRSTEEQQRYLLTKLHTLQQPLSAAAVAHKPTAVAHSGTSVGGSRPPSAKRARREGPGKPKGS